MATTENVIFLLTIIITVAYLSYTIWSMFITKKREEISGIDILYFAFLSAVSTVLPIFYGLLYGWIAVLIIVIMMIIWALIMDYRLEKNIKLKENKGS